MDQKTINELKATACKVRMGVIEGHDYNQIEAAFNTAKTVKGKPTAIVMKTTKGKGVSFMEGKNTWHGKAIDDESFKIAMEELGGSVNG